MQMTQKCIYVLIINSKMQFSYCSYLENSRLVDLLLLELNEEGAGH